MGTRYEVTLVNPPATLDAAALTQVINATLARITATFSTYKSSSELSRFNRHPTTEWVTVSPALFAVLRMARTVHQVTQGAFEPTVAPLVKLWGFADGEQPSQAPPQDDILAALETTGMRHLELHAAGSQARKRNSKLSLNLNAIAKGYGVDQLARSLESAGVRRYLINIGGEIRVKGRAPRGIPWRIGIERPAGSTAADGAGSPVTLRMTEGAVATSGDYRNFFVANGKRFSHLIDPITGHPVEHGLASVTVLHNQAAIADALATGLLVLGPRRGIAIAMAHDLPAYFIGRGRNGAWQIQATAALEPFLSRQGAPAPCAPISTC